MHCRILRYRESIRKWLYEKRGVQPWIEGRNFLLLLTRIMLPLLFLIVSEKFPNISRNGTHTCTVHTEGNGKCKYMY